jgi:hypothetical protein
MNIEPGLTNEPAKKTRAPDTECLVTVIEAIDDQAAVVRSGEHERGIAPT